MEPQLYSRTTRLWKFTFEQGSTDMQKRPFQQHCMAG